MKQEKFCQSCSMPLDNPDHRGTEIDGSKSHEYCSYCYQNGSFTNPGMSFKDMMLKVITQMEKMNFDPQIIDVTLSNLPNLKRWKRSEVAV